MRGDDVLYGFGCPVSPLVDQSNGVQASYGYAAYGGANPTLTKTTAGFNPTSKLKTNPYEYTGKRYDTGSATLDMGARRYSASTGRFLQQDVYHGATDNLGLALDPLTANRYLFTGANPVNYVEVDGHFVAYDDTGGKPPTGYGSGPNGGSPSATPEQTAAILRTEASRLNADLARMCLRGGAYEFAGPFCQAAFGESGRLRNQANIVAGLGRVGVQLTVGGAFGGGFVCEVTLLNFWQIGCGVSAGLYADVSVSAATGKHASGCWARGQLGARSSWVNVSAYVEGRAVGAASKRSLVVNKKLDAGVFPKKLSDKLGLSFGASVDVICFT